MKTKRTMKKAILSLLALCSVAGMRAQIRSVEPSAATAKRYERIDFTVRLKATYSNAFLQEEVALDMLIRTPGARSACSRATGSRARPANSRAGRRASCLSRRANMPSGSG